MATKAEIANDLRRFFGKSCISITDVAKYTGVNWEQAKRDLEKVPYIEQRHRQWCDAREACELALAALREKQERDG